MKSINSREYKLMLRASKFNGDREALRDRAHTLWSELAAIIVPHAIAVSGTEEVEQKRRQVRFLDTREHWLRSHDYVVRERIDLDKAERTVTLKFRHADRYISQDRDMKPAEDFEGDMKFEEDIKPEFQKVYSFSSNTVVPADTSFDKLGDVADIYPGLALAVDEFPQDEELETVRGFTAYELVAKGTSFQIRKDPEVPAECSLTIWYADETDDKPIIAEFSFKYQGDEDSYSAKMAQRAYNAFIAIQNNLGDWLDPKSMTKTAFVYQK